VWATPFPIAGDETYLDLPRLTCAAPAGGLLVAPFEGPCRREAVESELYGKRRWLH